MRFFKCIFENVQFQKVEKDGVELLYMFDVTFIIVAINAQNYCHKIFSPYRLRLTLLHYRRSLLLANPGSDDFIASS